MENLMDSISSFIGKLIAVTIVGGGILLLAGEIRLACLKKASHGSTNLSTFTARMTNSK
jgi:hypothetical protein